MAVVVSNAKKSAAGYRDELGFEVRDQDGHWVTVAPKHSPVALHLCKQTKLKAGQHGDRVPVEGSPADVQGPRGEGVAFERKYAEADWGTFAKFKDPDGNVFWLVPA